MNKGTPRFRAEHVGSLLRPKAVLDARAALEAGRLSAQELRAIEDDAIRTAVRLQEDAGLQCVTDGELRRGTWHMDFLCRMGGVVSTGKQDRPFRNEAGPVKLEIETPKVVRRLSLDKPIFGEDFAFLKSIARATPKLTIPSPSILHGLGGAPESGVYRDEAELLDDLVRIYAKQIRLLHEIGCTYLQIDDTMFATLADPAYRDRIGVSANRPHLLYIDLINRALQGRPEGMTVCMHTCRGNHRSAWVASGSYDAVAEAVFSDLDVDGFFLEYDDARSGTFEPLRFVPDDKSVVLGLVTSKKGALERKDDLKRRVDDASRYVSLDRLALSPQCGFASTLHGNLLTEAEQYAKLRLVVETAREIWGSA